MRSMKAGTFPGPMSLSEASEGLVGKCQKPTYQWHLQVTPGRGAPFKAPSYLCTYIATELQYLDICKIAARCPKVTNTRFEYLAIPLVTFLGMVSSRDPFIRGWNGDLQRKKIQRSRRLNHLVDDLCQLQV